LVIYCRQTTGVSAAHATHCATHCTPCRPLIRALSGWIRTPPLTNRTSRGSCCHGLYGVVNTIDKRVGTPSLVTQ
jgi:hypothetical protein